MPDLILTAEQVQAVTESLDSVTVRDTAGKILGYLELKLPPEIIAELKRRAASPGPYYTGQQIQARLRALQEEWDRTGGFDQAYLKDFLARLDEADSGHVRQLVLT